VTTDDELRDTIVSGYNEDAWSKKLLEGHNEMPGVELKGNHFCTGSQHPGPFRI